MRALSAAFAARAMSSTVAPERSWLVAPDFSFVVGPTPPRSLKDFRGKAVLLVLYEPPGSRARMSQLAVREGTMAALGAEVIAVPTDAARDAIRRLGAEPRALFQVADGGRRPHPDDVSALRRRAPRGDPDRPPGVRSRHRESRGEAADIEPLLAQIQELGQEKTTGQAPPEEHVH